MSRSTKKPTQLSVHQAKTQISLGGCKADPSFHWALMSFCWFCHEQAQIKIIFWVMYWLFRSEQQGSW